MIQSPVSYTVVHVWSSRKGESLGNVWSQGGGGGIHPEAGIRLDILKIQSRFVKFNDVTAERDSRIFLIL